MPWPFRRKRRAIESPAGGTLPPASSTAPAGPSGVEPAGNRHRVAPRAWATMEPLPTTVGRASTVGEADQFVAGLGANRPLIQAPVMFVRSAEGPHGIVHGLTVPLPSEMASTPYGPGTEAEPEPAALSEPFDAPLPPVTGSARQLPVVTGPAVPSETAPLDRFSDELPMITAPPVPPVAPEPSRPSPKVERRRADAGIEPGEPPAARPDRRVLP